MNLYEVIRWGNELDDPETGGANGPDTCFLVRADTLESAVALVDTRLARMPSDYVQAWAEAVYLLGTDSGSGSETRILRGPYVEHAYRHGWRHWYRNAQDEPWEERHGA
jgi:hypothetical protein